MGKVSKPVAAFVFDAFGIIAWFAAGWWLYQEESVQTTVPAESFANGVANYQLMHLQMEMLITACSLAIVGTLFLGFAAVVKAIYRSSVIPQRS